MRRTRISDLREAGGFPLDGAWRPTMPLPLSRILRYDLPGTQALIAQGEADAQRVLKALS